MTKTEQRKVALILLDEQNGMDERAYDIMKPYIDDDIVAEVEVAKGRAYVADEDYAETELAKMDAEAVEEAEVEVVDVEVVDVEVTDDGDVVNSPE